MNNSAHRLRQLDGLRAIAVMGVIFDHATLWKFWVHLGPMSVRLFFVLSGFLITGILLRSRESAGEENRSGVMRAFYARRFLRIFPVYYASLLLLYALGHPGIRETIGWHAAYLSNFLNATPSCQIGSVWGHLWSLSVEEQFYLLWPAVILFTPIRYLPAVLLAAIASAPLFRCIAGEIGGYKPAFFLTPGCLDSLGLGAFLAWLFHHPELDNVRTRLCRWALPVGLALTVFWSIANNVDTAYRFRVMTRDSGPSLVFFWLVNGAAVGFPGWWGRLLEAKALSYIAAISYGMYLFHGFIPWFCELAGYPLPPHGLLQFVILTPMTIAMAALSWHLFEKPLNDLKDRFPYVRRPAAPVAAPAEPISEWSAPANS